MPQPIPDLMKVREIKYGLKATAADRSRLGAALLAAGSTAEGLDLYLLARDEAGIADVKRLAIKEGRPLLLAMLQREGRPASVEEWRQCGEACFAAARWREAYRAFVAAGDEAALARVRERIPDFEPYTPIGK